MKAIIIESGTRDIDDVRGEMLDWARGLGVDTKHAAAGFALIKGEDGWRAYFSMKCQRDGHDYVQPGTNRVATDYASYAVDVESWPGWFGAPDEVPDVHPATLLEVLAAAADARVQLTVGANRRKRAVGQ